MINPRLKILMCMTMLLTFLQASAENPVCKDTAEHNRLQQAMWATSSQDSMSVVYDACMAFLNHAKADGDMVAANSAWVCGIMYTLGRMNISSAYHIVEGMKNDIMNSQYPEEAHYFISNMMGHVYNTCGNIPGAEAEFMKSAEQIKGTAFERDGLAFVYLALAHVHLNNSLQRTLYWLRETEMELGRNKDSWNYYRCLTDVYAIKAIVRFKQKDLAAFRRCIDKMEESESKNAMPSVDLFAPYARIYKTLVDGDAVRALAEAEAMSNIKERYLLKCDIYRYMGDNEKAFMTQRELMHMRDSITGVMIAENMQRQEDEMQLMVAKQKSARIMNYVLCGIVLLALLFIIMLHRNIYLRRRYNRQLKAKNEELNTAYKQVAAADEMKTEFIRSVSHEIRTPLNIINGFSQVLTDQEADMNDDERREVNKTIGNSTRQITSLVNKMLALANESTKDLLSQVEQTDGLKICQEAIANMPEVDPEKIKVSLDDQTNGDAMLYTHGDSLLQMLGNLLENSVKFTEQGHILLTLRKDGQQMLFTVEDTGCGIPADKVDTIFERFVKVDEFKEGLGLGLAYCHETVQKLGGSLTLDKTSETGTTFTLRLPVQMKKSEKGER